MASVYCSRVTPSCKNWRNPPPPPLVKVFFSPWCIIDCMYKTDVEEYVATAQVKNHAQRCTINRTYVQDADLVGYKIGETEVDAG